MTDDPKRAFHGVNIRVRFISEPLWLVKWELPDLYH